MKLSGISQLSAVVACCAALLLSSCAATDPPTPTPTASASDPAAVATVSPPAEGAAVSAAALCAFLRDELPKLRQAQSDLIAMSSLTVDLFTWYDNQGAVPNGADMDTLTLKECPDVRAEVIKLAGIEAFSAL